MPDLTIVSPRGTITIAREIVAAIVAETAARSYGVVGLAAGSRVGRLLRRPVVVEHGLNLAEVAATVRSQVGYEVERLTGLAVATVEVVVDDVRVTA